MPHYSCDPDLELNGQTARSLVENVNQDDTNPFVSENGLDNIDPEAWYPVQDVLNVMNSIAESGSPMSHYVAIGMKAAELSYLPPEVSEMSFGEFLVAYGQIYPQHHRNGDAGTVDPEQLSPTHVRLAIDVPYPDDVMYGVIFGFARRLLDNRVQYSVYYDEENPPRDMGGDATIIHVEWDA